MASDTPIRSLCVYCASSTGSDPAIVDATAEFGSLLARSGIDLVYGGGAVGLMGVLADSVLAGGGRATGIMPRGLFPSEVAHSGLTEMIEVASMHERKAMMMDRADAIVALPGGFGTLEELAEALTWLQIGIHPKPVGLYNMGGFWDPLLAWADNLVELRLLKESNRGLMIAEDDPERLLTRLAEASPVEPKWVSD